MSFSIRNKNDVTYVFENSATSLPPLPPLPTATTYGEYLFYNDVAATYQVAGAAVRIGNNSGQISQGSNSVAIGNSAGQFTQSILSVAIGNQAGQAIQNASCVAIGCNAGQTSQITNAVAIGNQAGRFSQGQHSVAIGCNAGITSQRNRIVGIGTNAGASNQATGSVAIGSNAGEIGGGEGYIAIGREAGRSNLGGGAIAIGAFTARTSSPASAIILNATGTDVSALTSNSFFVAPIRQAAAGTARVLVYNTTTKEIIDASDNTKTFVIPHPIDSNKYLVHGCLEGPESGVYYRGEGEITNGEYADITLPEYASNFTNFTVNITPITHTLYSSSGVNNGTFRVRGENGSFFWLVRGTRNKINVEPLKNEVNVSGEGPYKYIC